MTCHPETRPVLTFIDASRGIAILMVILVHTAQSIDGVNASVMRMVMYGQMGVQLFFVVSAYTLCLSWYARRAEPAPIASFYVRRFFRIAPLYWLGIPLYAVAGGASIWHATGSFAVPQQYSPVNVVVNLLLLHGFYPPANNTIVPGGWSIGTEAAFYFVFPLMMALVQRFDVKSPARWLAVVVAWSAIVQTLLLALRWGFGIETQNGSFLYWSIVIQSQVFLVGIAFYHVNLPRSATAGRVATFCVAAVSLTAMAAWMWSLRIGHLFSIIPVVAGVAFCCVIAILEMMPRLCHPFLCRIGQVSYSMYLFHFLLAHTGLRFVNECVQYRIRGTIALGISYLVIVALTFLIAVLSERYIERPGIALGRRILQAMHARQRSKDPRDTIP